LTQRSLVRVLVIDDSAFSRQVITRMLRASPLVEVVGVARDGEEALRKTFELEPDLVTLDLEMPKMDGFTFLRLVMSKRPTPVIVISGRAGDADVFRALELGAVDFLAKPTPHATPELASIERELIRKVHAIRELRIEKVQGRIGAVSGASDLPTTSGPQARVVAIGSSTGGPAALIQIFAGFATPPPCAFVVAQHMPEGFTRGFAERIDRLTCLGATEARGGEEPKPGSVLIAPGGSHLEFATEGSKVCAKLNERLESDKYAPSVDRLFASTAKHFGSEAMAVVLTGMGDDGRQGVTAVKQAGGRVLAESEETAVIFGMPQQAIRTGVVDQVLPLGEIAGAIHGGGGTSVLDAGSSGGDSDSRRGPK
jgi:two-component system chemotaxis response regulator CheB